MDLKKKDDEVVRLVRKYVNENENDFEEEPREPFPQDCCGQSCKPCVFDIHHDDVVRWAKEQAKQIEYDDSTLYQYLFDDCPPSDESKEWFFNEFRSLEIADMQNLNNNTVLVKLRTPEPLLIPIASHIRIRQRVDNHLISRQYTPTCVAKDCIEVPIKIYDDGKLSSNVRNWKVGDSVDCRGPYTDDNGWLDASHLLIAAAGTGIAPFVRIVDHLLSEENEKTVVCRICLLYCVRTIDDVIFASELTEWARSWNVRVSLVLSSLQANDSLPEEIPYLLHCEKGRLCEDLMEKYLNHLHTSRENIKVAVCGPTTFEKDAINFAIKAGVKSIIRFHS